ncbi:MAG TPA: DNA recombination protein RmuC [Alphaproteobacteria bacterium]|nr:DNA recombination protein RmuC [Alphaproteobacteria bacterium]
MLEAIFLLVGMIIGAGLVWSINHFLLKKDNEKNEHLKAVFNELSQSALDTQSERFLQLAQTKLEAQTKEGEKDLEGKKKLIDSSLTNLKGDLNKVENLISEMEKQRSQTYGSLSNQLKTATEQTVSLQQVTNELKSVLSNTKVRGQWGERMAEDILRMAGFIEGVQYEKQEMQEGGKSKPDFTFKMPDGHILNMDVKFPLNSYLNYLSAEADVDKESHKKQFLRDAKLRITEIGDRNYINNNTLDYVLLFIPNEQVYSFINEHDRTILDEALKRKVIICGPNTLYAILAVVRQAADNFQLEKTSSEILKVLADFKKQWSLYTSEFEKLDKQFDTFEKTFSKVKLDRSRLLEKQLDKVEELRNRENLKQLTLEEK